MARQEPAAYTMPPRTAGPPVSAPPQPVPAPPAGSERLGWRTRLAGLRRRIPRPGDARPAFRPQALGLALVAIVVVLGTLTGLYLQGYLHARAVANARDEALQTAKVGVPRFASYDYRHFDADVTTAGKYLTSGYRKQYADFQNKAVRTTAIKYHAVVTAQIEFAGVVSGGTGKVRLLIFLNQTTTETKLAAPKIAQNRVRVEMRKVGGDWRISQITSF